MKRIKDLLLLPFKNHLFFFLFLFVGLSPYVIHQVLDLGRVYDALFVSVHCLLLSYILTLLVALIKPKSVRITFQVVLGIVMAIIFVWNFYCVMLYNDLLDEDYLILILGTNLSEAIEFLTTQIPISTILAVVGTFVALFTLWWFLRHCGTTWVDRLSVPILILLALLFAVHARVWTVWYISPIYHISKLVSAVKKYELPDVEQLNNSHPRIVTLQGNEYPSTVVLIIGESFARGHCSLYRYEKQTNPRLQALRDSSMLYTFDSINSSAPFTAVSLKYMISTYNKADSATSVKEWYEYPTLIELMHACGYDSYWFSNQFRAGKFNSISRLYAQSCEHSSFYQNGRLRVFDQVLVDSTNQVVTLLRSGRHFVIYHMIGSHFEYSLRYPKSYAHFSKEDYPEWRAFQRSVVATYDNTILYNDFVVREIMDMYCDRDAVVIYVPDHGEDMYVTDPEFHMHAKPNDPESWAEGTKIPFMVYASPLFQQKYPDVMERIKNRQEHPKAWNTDDLPYFIMDLIGVTAINGEPVAPRSVL